MKKRFLLVTVCIFLSACAAIDRQLVSDDQIKEKTSFAIGIPPEKIEIIGVTGNGWTVSYKAKVLGENQYFSCYYTTTAYAQSDSLCTAISSNLNQSEKPTKSKTYDCNELLRAAGKCR